MLPPGLNAVSALLGVVLVAAPFDIVWTTMSLNQAGPVTRRVSRAIWTGCGI